MGTNPTQLEMIKSVPAIHSTQQKKYIKYNLLTRLLLRRDCYLQGIEMPLESPEMAEKNRPSFPRKKELLIHIFLIVRMDKDRRMERENVDLQHRNIQKIVAGIWRTPSSEHTIG
jgi:hypothetical protein